MGARLSGAEGGREGLILKLHHSYTDGLGAVKLALELFDTERQPAPDPGPLRTYPGSGSHADLRALGTPASRQDGPPGAPRGCALGGSAVRDVARDPRRGPGRPWTCWIRYASGPSRPRDPAGPSWSAARGRSGWRPSTSPWPTSAGRPARRGHRQRPVPGASSGAAASITTSTERTPHAAGGDAGQHPAGRRPDMRNQFAPSWSGAR